MVTRQEWPRHATLAATKRPLRWLLLILTVLGVAISAKVVPSAFTVDDVNYLVNVVGLRQGRVTVANTEGLSPSRELAFFDPTSSSRSVSSTPVASTAPPLYALLAFPFSTFGWHGLVALNTLSYLATILIVFVHAGRYAQEPSTPWLAAAAVGLAGYALEYAQGVWPQALSLALCTGGIVAAGRALEGRALWLAPLAGVLLGGAAGVRYQNAVIVAAVAGAIVLLARRRLSASSTYVFGAAVPLACSSLINHFRSNSWNPVSKGPGYLSTSIGEPTAGSWFDPLRMFWAQVVDYSVRPRLAGAEAEGWLTYDPTTGAHLLFNATLKKAFLQSAPWAALAFVLLAAAWIPWTRMPEARRRQLRLLSLVTGAVVCVFSLAGTDRHDGLGFNQRYLLELLPLAAIAFAWAIDGLGLRRQPLVIGALSGVALVLVILLGTPIEGGPSTPLWLVRQIALLKAPLIIAAAMVVLWSLATRRGEPRQLTAVIVGIGLGWGLALHLADDVFAAQRVRADNFARTEVLSQVLTDRSAFVAYRAGTLAAAPLLLDRDIVILDAGADDGVDVPKLIRELLSQGRRVFLLKDGFRADTLERVLTGLAPTPISGTPLPMVEIRLLQ